MLDLGQLAASLTDPSTRRESSTRDPRVVVASIAMGAAEVRDCVNADAGGKVLAPQIAGLFCDVVLLAHLCSVDLASEVGVYVDKWSCGASRPDLRQVH